MARVSKRVNTRKLISHPMFWMAVLSVVVWIVFLVTKGFEASLSLGLIMGFFALWSVGIAHEYATRD